MASLGEDFRTFLLASSDIAARVGTRVYQNEVQQEEGAALSDYIWYERANIEREDTLDMAAGERPWVEFLNVEAVSTDIDNALDLADDLRGLHGSGPGDFGGGTAQAVFVTDQTDDYIPRGDGDGGRHVAALSFQVIGHSPT